MRRSTSADSDWSSSGKSEEDHYLNYAGDVPRQFRDYYAAGQRRPLIDQVNNSWQQDEKAGHYRTDEEDFDEPEYPSCCDVLQEDSCLGTACEVVRNRRFRKAMFLLVAILLTIFFYWRQYVKPTWNQDRLFHQGLTSASSGFGIQKGEKFKNAIQIDELGKDKLPGGEHDEEGKRRLIFIGDIHGCKQQCMWSLIRRIAQRYADLLYSHSAVRKGSL